MPDADAAEPPSIGDSAWHSVWLHGDWYWLTKNMTTEQREHAADAVARYHRQPALQAGVSDHVEPDGMRWWRTGS